MNPENENRMSNSPNAGLKARSSSSDSVAIFNYKTFKCGDFRCLHDHVSSKPSMCKLQSRSKRLLCKCMIARTAQIITAFCVENVV